MAHIPAASMSFRAILSALLVILALGFAPPGHALDSHTLDKGLETLVFVTSSGEHKFEVEVADTEAERARGLMRRRSMPADHGMLFDFKMEAPVSMWMKNTYIPLDMVFVSRQGVVVSIARETEPMSERIIPSGGPVYAVIELNAGAARRVGLEAGDKVRHRIFEH